MKYLYDFPRSFATVQDARAFCEGFFTEYNHVHHNSGIGWHTPASAHFGTASAVDQARQVTLNAAYAAHPERFARRPEPPQIPEHSWINQPNQNYRTPDHRTVSLDLTDTGARRSTPTLPADPRSATARLTVVVSEEP